MRQFVAHGNRHLEQGDLFPALPWLVEALALEEGNGPNEEVHRIRVGALLRQCPRLKEAFFVDGWVSTLALSPDGKRLFTVHQSWGTATGQVWDVEAGAVLCRLADFNPGSTVPLQFSPDGKRILVVDDSPGIWDTTTGQRLMTLPRGDDFWHRAVF